MLLTLIQLMPFPVVCGFLAGTGWLFLSAGITMMTDIEVHAMDLGPILATDKLIHWLPALICGIAVYIMLEIKDHFLILPVALIACAAGFYAVVWWFGLSPEALREGGWMFHIEMAGSTKGLASLDFSNVNLKFIGSVMPQIGTIVLISMLTASFSFSAMELGTGTILDLNSELRGHGNANLLSGMGLGLPGSCEVASSIMFSNMGATSRLLAIFCGLACLAAAIFGGNIIEHVPKIVMAALVFMAGIQFIHEWLLTACKQMHLEDIISVWLIFSVIVLIGFVPGVLVGIVLTSLLFIIRISKIDVIGSSFQLNQMSSSVERSLAERRLLQEYGKDVRIFNLRGFLFFGSANAFFERIKSICDQDIGHSYFVFNFRRVIGIDSTAVQVFLKLNNMLDSKAIKPVFCGLNEDVLPTFTVTKIFESGGPLVLKDLDLAMKWIEEKLVEDKFKVHGNRNIVSILGDILGDHEKAEKLVSTMERITFSPGEYLFKQGDVETTIYVIETGAVEVQLKAPNGLVMRLRELRQGSLVGEMAAYSTEKERSASALVTEAAIIYRLKPENLQLFGERSLEYKVLIHEMVVRLLASRLTLTNQRNEADF